MILRREIPDENPRRTVRMLWREVKWVGTTDMFNVGVSQAEYLGGGGRLVCARVGPPPSEPYFYFTPAETGTDESQPWRSGLVPLTMAKNSR